MCVNRINSLCSWPCLQFKKSIIWGSIIWVKAICIWIATMSVQLYSVSFAKIRTPIYFLVTTTYSLRSARVTTTKNRLYLQSQWGINIIREKDKVYYNYTTHLDHNLGQLLVRGESKSTNNFRDSWYLPLCNQFYNIESYNRLRRWVSLRKIIFQVKSGCSC